MKNVVTDLAVARKPVFIIEEVTTGMINHMRFLAMGHRDIGMLIEMIVQRARPAFLSSCDNEIQSLNFGRS